MSWKGIAMVCILCALLTGCASWMDGSYTSSKPHKEQSHWQEQSVIPVENYGDLLQAMSDIVENGEQSATLGVEMLRRETLDARMREAISQTLRTDPIAAYAVSDISYELGMKGGYFVAEISVTYNNKYSLIDGIQHVTNMREAEQVIYTALDNCASGAVLEIDGYSAMDYTQLVQLYAQNYPDKVMELPSVIANEYPKNGSLRVLELSFNYQTDRGSLRSMQEYVEPIFAAAALSVSGEKSESIKYEQMYAYLMGRYTYRQETSITPAYSLLRHGLGDSKAFASVYAAMCRRAGLQCQVITGTKKGAPWSWNMICVDGSYYHLDLLGSDGQKGYRLLTDRQMSGYVWDYSSYPPSGTKTAEGTGSVQ